MKRLLRIARTELLEHRRQPWMIAILVASYLAVAGLFVISFLMIDMMTRSPATGTTLRQQVAALGLDWDAFLKGASNMAATISFGYLQIVVAYMCPAIVLHDRQLGTMPFLRLAPLTPFQLLLGKVLGAMAIPTGLHFVFVAASNLVLARLDTFAPYAYELGGSAAWWIAFVVGTPASALMVGAFAAVISANSRDVRGSTQFSNLMINVLGIGFAFVLAKGLYLGPALQFAFAVGSLAISMVLLAIAVKLINANATP